MIGRDGEKRSGISVLMAKHDDNCFIIELFIIIAVYS